MTEGDFLFNMGKDTYYFPHDFNARNDPKLIALRHKYKAVGMAVYWTIIEFLHEQEGNKFEPKSYIISTLAEQSGANAEQVLEVIKSCIEEFDLLRSDEGCYVSDRVLRNIQKREEISEARSISGKKGALSKANAKQMPANAEQKQANAKQSSTKKRKEIKEIDIVKRTPILFKESQYFNKELFFKSLKSAGPPYNQADPKSYYDKAYHWSESDTNKKVDWMATVKNWIRKDFEEKKMPVDVSKEDHSKRYEFYSAQK